jgi:hypothetical protein
MFLTDTSDVIWITNDERTGTLVVLMGGEKAANKLIVQCQCRCKKCALTIKTTEGTLFVGEHDQPPVWNDKPARELDNVELQKNRGKTT